MSCGCVSVRAKRALLMLSRATVRRLIAGRDPTLPEKGKVGVRMLRELQSKGYLELVKQRGARRWAVTSLGGDKVLEWRRLGLV